MRGPSSGRREPWLLTEAAVLRPDLYADDSRRRPG